MKLAWLQDMHPMASPGGAQMTDATHMLAGMKRGHEIFPIIGPGMIKEAEGVPFDGFIISNIRTFPPETFTDLVASGAPLVFFYHDYDCRWRLYYPMQDKCRACYTRERWLPIYDEAKLHIWLSPLHRNAWMHTYPEMRSMPYELVPSPVQKGHFFNKHGERKGAIAVNAHLPFKGGVNFIQWASSHPDIPITLVGTDDHSGLPLNVTPVGNVGQPKLNDLLNEHELFVDFPMTPQPFNRTAAEAYMAGCDIETNGLLGALSWSFWKKGPAAVAEACSTAPDRFWKAVEKALA